MDRLRYRSLLGAILLYALLSSPTPDHPGWIEAAIGALLILACLKLPLIKPHSTAVSPALQISGIVCLIYGSFIMLPTGLLYQNNLIDIVRDFIPFLYWLLPIFTVDLFRERPAYARRFTLLLWLCGGIIALRSFRFDPAGYVFDLLMPGTLPAQELYYLANSPLILFSACFSLFLLTQPAKAHGLRKAIFSLTALTIFLLCLSAMMLTLQRASVAALVIFYVLVFLHCLYRRRWLGALILALPVFGILIVLPDIHTLLNAMVLKTQTYGVNMRDLEWLAVWNESTQSITRFIFGGGWGAVFVDPASGYDTVSFTHSMISASLLKGGIIGVLIFGAYLSIYTGKLIHLLRLYFLPACMILAPFLIDVFLYGAYKSLDFGLLLLTIPMLFAVKSSILLNINHPSCKT